MTDLIESIRGEYVRYKKLAEDAMAQLDDVSLVAPGPNNGNSIATICWHVSGNLVSRFTDFLEADGEKPWRHREQEFHARTVTRDELLANWAQGWDVLFGALDRLNDGDLSRTVTIRQQPLRVDEALHRSVTHVSYHVGQIVYLAKAMRGKDWRYLSIPPGMSDAYSATPGNERPR
jgi:hypothetical protein